MALGLMSLQSRELLRGRLRISCEVAASREDIFLRFFVGSKNLAVSIYFIGDRRLRFGSRFFVDVEAVEAEAESNSQSPAE